MLPDTLTVSSLQYRRVTPAVQPRFTGWRVLHSVEGGYPTPDRMPEVRPSIDAPAISFTRAMQRLSYEINQSNSYFTGERWRVVYGYKTAFTNQNGFLDPGDPRADFVNGLDTDKPLPKLMKAIICGGMFIRGDVIGNDLVCVPGVHGIDVSTPMPSVEEVIERNWYFTATTRAGDRVNNFPQGQGGPVFVPYFLRETTKYPLWFFGRWDDFSLPDPLAIYRKA